LLASRVCSAELAGFAALDPSCALGRETLVSARAGESGWPNPIEVSK
jgi:hypothetical protein